MTRWKYNSPIRPPSTAEWGLKKAWVNYFKDYRYRQHVHRLFTPDPLKFYAIIGPRLVADLDAEILPPNDTQENIITRRIHQAKRDILLEYGFGREDRAERIADHARTYFRWRDHGRMVRKQADDQARQEFAADPPEPLTLAELKAEARARAINNRNNSHE